MINDVAVIGGGAAGLALAVMLKQKCPSVGVAVFEASDRVGKKLSVTGNGRCNISNTRLAAERYHGDGEFAADIIGRFGYEKQREFFKTLGVPFTVEDDGKAYPMSLQAASVTDALRFFADESGVETLCGCAVTAVERTDGGFVVAANGEKRCYKSVAVASGGRAGTKAGNTGYDILKSFGHKIEPLFPSIVRIDTETETVRQLKGIKTDAFVTAVSDKGSRTEFGEVLFCDTGISGPPVLQVSRLANGNGAFLMLDLLPQMTEEEIKTEILKRTAAFPERSSKELLCGFANKRLGQVIMKKAGADLNGLCKDVDGKTAETAAKLFKSLRLKVTGTAGFENAQVTAGGAQCAQFFPDLMSKKAKGLFAVGEVLDVDGDCGGFNLAFAWASADAASDGILRFLGVL